MDLHSLIPVCDLQLFSDGGAAGSSGAAASGTGVTAPAAGVQTGVKGNQQTGIAGAEVTPAAGVNADPKQDREAEFRKLITGDYKDLFDAHVQGIVKNRLKGPTADAQRYRSLAPALDLLAQRYGIADKTDADAINKALVADAEIIERLAYEKNQTPEEFLGEWKRNSERVHLEQENKRLQAIVDEQREKEAALKIYQMRKAQAEEAKKLYPSFDLDAELRNPVFQGLLKSPHMTVLDAYEKIHRDEIRAGLLRHATEEAARQVAANVAANGARPNENGMGANGAASVKMDPGKMTKAQRRELNRRAAMGEKISF